MPGESVYTGDVVDPLTGKVALSAEEQYYRDHAWNDPNRDIPAPGTTGAEPLDNVEPPRPQHHELHSHRRPGLFRVIFGPVAQPANPHSSYTGGHRYK